MIVNWYKGAKQRASGMEDRCNRDYLNTELTKLIPDEKCSVTLVEINKSGIYNNPLQSKFPPQYAAMFKVENLPDYCEINIQRSTKLGNPVNIIIWAPLDWNGRFIATAGAGMRTGGHFQMGRPDEYSRGMTLPLAVINGFVSATTDGGVHEDGRWPLDANEKLKVDLLEEWEHVATHKMTIITKAVVKVLYGKYPEYNYIHGASGGGRQSVMVAQRYPEDYNGIWASCPAINFLSTTVGFLWVLAVANDNHVKLSAAKLLAFERAVHEKYGGTEKFFQITEIAEFDAFDALGTITEDGEITELDCKAMNEIWQGVIDGDGNKIWYGFRPGVRFWNADGPAAAALYFIDSENGKKPKVFSLFSDMAGIIEGSLTKTYENITKKEVIEIIRRGEKMFPTAQINDPDLRQFAKCGGRLVIDHGTHDALLACDGTIDYYNKVIALFGESKTKEFFRMFFNAGDGHGNCYEKGPGLPESECMNALMNWVENGIAPQTAKGVQVDQKTSEIIQETVLYSL